MPRRGDAADALDAADLAAGLDIDRAEDPPAPHPTPHPPRSPGKLAAFAERYRLRQALFRDGDEPGCSPPRPRLRPKPTAEQRARDRERRRRTRLRRREQAQADAGIEGPSGGAP
ncbi:MAG TPA: hypothetical protein VMS17_13340 [Gemmataceae bacterium]|nr:hypothetical protein [Gemmataceae bacterium]